MGLNLHSRPFSFLLHQPFLSSLTGSVDEPSSRGLRNGEHFANLHKPCKENSQWLMSVTIRKTLTERGLGAKGRKPWHPPQGHFIVLLCTFTIVLCNEYLLWIPSWISALLNSPLYFRSLKTRNYISQIPCHVGSSFILLLRSWFGKPLSFHESWRK